MESGIRDGRLIPGEALPPVRGLAADLGVSPATVAAAYRALRDRGVVETAGRSGTRVRSRPPVAVRSPRPVVPPGTRDLASGAPDPALLPSLGGYAIDARPVNYGHGGPLDELLDAARERLGADGVPGTHLTVTGGALDGIERMLGAHLRPGDRVAVEDPGWGNLFDLVAALGLTPVPVPVDAAGPTEEGLRGALAAGVAAVIVTGRAQNPTGAMLSATRARALRRLLRQYPKNLVIEDDHAAELARGEAHPLAGATESCRVEGRMRVGTGWVSTILQRLVLALWRDAEVGRTIARASKVYAQRRAALRDALGELAGPGESGINIWIPVIDETRVVSALREEGYAVAPGSRYRLASPPGIRVTTATLPVEEAPRVAAAIRRAISSAPARWY